MSNCEAHRAREEYIHPSAHHTQANVDIKEENSGPKNIMVDELDCDHLNKNRQDTVLFDSIDVPKGYTALRLVRQIYGVDKFPDKTFLLWDVSKLGYIHRHLGTSQ